MGQVQMEECNIL